MAPPLLDGKEFDEWASTITKSILVGRLASGEYASVAIEDDGSLKIGGAMSGGLTNSELRAEPVIIAGSVAATCNFPETQPITAEALPLPAGASTEATLAAIKAKTDNLDVALSTRAVTGLTDSELRASPLIVVGAVNATCSGTVSIAGPVAVTGAFFQTTQPVSCETLPLPSGASTEATLGTRASEATLSALNGKVTACNTGAVTVASCALPSGASTEATLAAIKAKTDNLDVALSTRAITGLTDAQLRASPITCNGTVAISGSVAVTGTFFQATQPVSCVSLPLPVGASTEATLAAIKAKTDNLDVALSTRAVTGLTDAQLRASAISMSAAALPLPAGAATEATLAAIGKPSALCATATGLSGAAVTLTIAAAGVGLFHYITHVRIQLYAAAARTGSANPIVVTTTNLPGSLAYTFETAQAIGTSIDRATELGGNPMKSSVANTLTQIVCPVATTGIWRITVHYYAAP